MSLKGFHLFFIAVSVLLALAVGAWGVQEYMAGGGGGRLALGVTFFLVGFVLIVYGLRVRQKLKALGGGPG